jgi:aryl-alcohol dehydrogenase-like predicted oxidoreductase
MLFAPLGGTGLSVSRIGLGLAALGRPGYINLGHAEDLERDYQIETMERHAHEALDAAWSAGVRYFDAARSYGRAEEFLASWLSAREIQPYDVVVGSKWGYTYTAAWRADAERHEVKEHSPAQLMRQLAESRALLGDQLDLYQIHSATLESGALDNCEILDLLGELKREGVKIGLTVTGPKQSETIARATTVESGGERLFDCVQATWNLLERSAEAELAEAHRLGMGTIVKEALANGRLTERNHDTAFASKRRILEDVARGLGASLDALALAAVLAAPWADVVLSGASTVAQLRSNLGALTVRIDERTRGELQSLCEEPEGYWTTRSRLPWN